MWIKVDGLRSEFGFSDVSPAKHIFLIPCMDGVIRHAYYRATACCLVPLNMRLQLGMQNHSNRESDLGNQKRYQVPRDDRVLLTLSSWPCPSGDLTLIILVYQPHRDNFTFLTLKVLGTKMPPRREISLPGDHTLTFQSRDIHSRSLQLFESERVNEWRAGLHS